MSDRFFDNFVPYIMNKGVYYMEPVGSKDELKDPPEEQHAAALDTYKTEMLSNGDCSFWWFYEKGKGWSDTSIQVMPSLRPDPPAWNEALVTVLGLCDKHLVVNDAFKEDIRKLIKS